MTLHHPPFYFQALEVCQQRNFVEETVFLLSESWFWESGFARVGKVAWVLYLFCLFQAGWETVDELCR